MAARPGALPPGPLFRIVQVEVAGEVDLREGRWTVRGHANRPEAVVVVETTERPRRRFGRRSRPGDDDGLVPVARLTVVDADPLDADDPDRWLAAANGADELHAALATLRRLLHLHRVAAAEPDPRPLRGRDLVRATLAYGTGEEGAYGRWTAARPVEVPAQAPERVRRSGRGIEADERLADLLSGRDAALAGEVLALAARRDLADGRTREAALGLRMALEAAIAELEPWRDAPHLDEALDALRDARPAVAAAAAAAVRGGLDDAQLEDVRVVLGTLFVALGRRAGGRRVGERAALPPRRDAPR
ncbi:hypothetical protein [Patulibacter sp. SYSU D01012]|uniref:hypothetical protein n=1 Tax=Patulibacter sp. SYSU D01012 TaxID=2817381 RepID=UPI001B316412|nr:hypothetical protein [Patulibacter sp. SYSU D01012]